MALITATVLCARSQDLLLSVPVRKVHAVLLTAGFKGGGKQRLRHVKKLPRWGEASRRSSALSWDQTQAIGVE